MALPSQYLYFKPKDYQNCAENARRVAQVRKVYKVCNVESREKRKGHLCFAGRLCWILEGAILLKEKQWHTKLPPEKGADVEVAGTKRDKTS